MLNWKIAGLAGGGIAVTGTLFAKLAMRHGLHVFTYGEYPSLIRGGHNTIQVTADAGPVTSQQKMLDVLVALNADGVKLHLGELSNRSLILVDKTQVKLAWDQEKILGLLVDLPMFKISLAVTGSTLAANMVALGASTYLLGLDLSVLHTLISDTFARKGDKVVRGDQQAAEQGYQFVQAQGLTPHPIVTKVKEQQIYVTGNEAIGLGAIAGGVQFYAAYPMTPTSSLLEFMADQQSRYPLVVKHAEDEIGAVNQAIGASFAGVRSMVGTSGGGFALMVEALALAAIAETPLVMVEGQRPGPATGLPTWTCQADLQFVLHAGHGEFARVVLCPGDMEEAFVFARLAMIVAEQWQTQVIILADKYLLESALSVPQFATQFTNRRYSLAPDNLDPGNTYERYSLTSTGISPRSLPGAPHGLQLTNSYEHDAHGYATEEGSLTVAMTDKRLHKLDSVGSVLPPPKILGPQTAELTFVTWGSTKLPIQTAIIELNKLKPNQANAIHLATLAPFFKEKFLELVKSSQRLIMVEGNATGQAEQVIRQQTGFEFSEHLRRYDGRPFYAEDLIAYVQKGVQS